MNRWESQEDKAPSKVRLVSLSFFENTVRQQKNKTKNKILLIFDFLNENKYGKQKKEVEGLVYIKRMAKDPFWK